MSGELNVWTTWSTSPFVPNLPGRLDAVLRVEPDLVRGADALDHPLDLRLRHRRRGGVAEGEGGRPGISVERVLLVVDVVLEALPDVDLADDALGDGAVPAPEAVEEQAEVGGAATVVAVGPVEAEDHPLAREDLDGRRADELERRPRIGEGPVRDDQTVRLRRLQEREGAGAAVDAAELVREDGARLGPDRADEEVAVGAVRGVLAERLREELQAPAWFPSFAAAAVLEVVDAYAPRDVEPPGEAGRARSGGASRRGRRRSAFGFGA